MTFDFDNPQVLLVDGYTAKTQMHLQTIVKSTFVKNGKKNPIVGEDVTKVTSGLNYTSCDTEAVNYGISAATIRNWEKLSTQSVGRLAARANKRKSKKRVLPIEYIAHEDNIAFVQDILDYVDNNSIEIMSAILSLGICLLKKFKLYGKEHVTHVLNEYAGIAVIDELLKANLPVNEYDILGLIYQSYLQEGKKNIIGSYYTPQKITYNMTKDLDFSNGRTFFDPCCGSGAFLLAVTANNPNQIYGIDSDRIAVLIAKINMLVKYRNTVFIPQIFCLDFLLNCPETQHHSVFDKNFDYIITNPPWGAMDSYGHFGSITSKETFSCFFVKAFGLLNKDGIIRFLFPEAILNVKAHKDIRKFMLEQTGLVSITTYDNVFSGVATKCVDIKCVNGTNRNEFDIYMGETQRIVAVKTAYETENLILNLLSDDELSIVRIFKSKGKYSLQNSIWALGIVTGDNKRKLSPVCLEGMEKIYTGKEILPYVLNPAKNYILYDRNKLQQVAKEEVYRAPEKLVYKFISNKLVFAYDNSGGLFLNSANILVPNVPSMNIKTVMAFLNSSLFQFMYIRLFGEVKILKGNLIELPFPEISPYDNETLSSLVEDVLRGDNAKQAAIEDYIFSLYGLTKKQITYIRRTVNGKAD